MAGSVNKVILVGNVGQDPEIRQFQNGGQVASFSLATSESWKDKASGEKKERTEWHKISIFNEGLVRIVQSYVKKGSKLYLEGQLETRKWQDKDGQDKFTTEVVLRNFTGNLTLLDSAGGGARGGARVDDDGGYGASAPGSSGGGSRRMSGPKESFSQDLDDEIPF
jgi:single-strand DNA-binding protein